MRCWLSVICVLCVFLFASCKERDAGTSVPEPANKKALLFTKTAGFRHESIAAGQAMFEAYKAYWKLDITASENTGDFNTANLEKYDLLIFLSTTGDLFTEEQQNALQAYMRNGGRLLGIHAATDAEYDWDWYGMMIGGYFASHPEIQEAILNVEMPKHETVAGLPSEWQRTDEWYNFQKLEPDNKIVISVDETTYIGGTNGMPHPVSWYREFEGGRTFYTAMGHTPETYTEPLFVQHIGNAIYWLTR